MTNPAATLARQLRRIEWNEERFYALINRVMRTLGLPLIVKPAKAGEVLDALQAASPRFAGIRHSAAWDADPEVLGPPFHAPQGLYLEATFREGFAEVGRRGLTFDAWLLEPQLPDLIDLATRLEGLGAGPFGHRAGDVLLLARSGARRPIDDRFYFSGRYRSWHGSPDEQDSRIPLIVAHAGTGGADLRAIVDAVTGELVREPRGVRIHGLAEHQLVADDDGHVDDRLAAQ